MVEMMDVAFIVAAIDVGFDIDQLARFERLVGATRAQAPTRPRFCGRRYGACTDNREVGQ
jgi:hypothetical protein